MNIVMTVRSAGFVMFRRSSEGVEVFLVPAVGPFGGSKDVLAWSLPNREHSACEDPFAAAVRGFEKETGVRPDGPFIPLGQIHQASGRRVLTVWAVDSEDVPLRTFPTGARGEWLPFHLAQRMILRDHAGFLELLNERLVGGPSVAARQTG